MINVKIKNTIRLPDKILVQDDLVHIADNIFIPILKNNIDQEVDLQEKRFRPISPSYVERKRRQGLSTKILTATGRLRDSFFSKKQGKSAVHVTLKSERKDIGGYLQNDMGFNFFGISTRMEKAAIKFMEDKIKRVINAVRR